MPRRVASSVRLLWGGLLVVCLAAGLLRPGAAAGAPAAGAGLIDRIDAAQRGLRTIQAEFVQRNQVKLFKQELVSRGRLLYERGAAGAPSRLRWEYVTPDPSTLLLTGPEAYLIMPGRAAQRFDLGKDGTLQAIFAELELWLGSGSLRAAEREYEVRETAGKGGPALVMVPRPGTPLSRTFSQIELRVDSKTAILRGILLVEKGGDQKEISFTTMNRNVVLPADAFKRP